jgi:hypothetical protein
MARPPSPARSSSGLGAGVGAGEGMYHLAEERIRTRGDNMAVIPAALSIHLCPGASSDGADNLWSSHQAVPCVTTGINNRFISFPALEAEGVAPEVFPDVLDGVQFWCVRRQLQKNNVFRNNELW